MIRTASAKSIVAAILAGLLSAAPAVEDLLFDLQFEPLDGQPSHPFTLPGTDGKPSFPGEVQMGILTNSYLRIMMTPCGPP